ncbi:hypothetical protein MMC15_006023 [Xylographa vitiligo]|nr:hypothetical protein [Xylographa vitiligo]
MDTCEPIKLIAVSLLRPDNHGMTERFRKDVMSPDQRAKNQLLMTDFEVDQIWFHIRNEHKEWADFVALHSDEKSFDYVRDRLFVYGWEELEVLEKRPPTFGGLKRTMNDLIDLDHHLETEYQREMGQKQKYKSRFFCPE